MSRLAALLLAVPLLAGCTSNVHWVGEGWKEYYGKPAKETSRRLLERKVIQHWTTDPRAKENVGMIEKYEVLFEGTRVPREYHLILNAPGTKRLGHVNEDGTFYRFRDDGGVEKVGEYVVFDTGLKVFFGYPLGDYLGFEEFDPYKD